MNKTVTFLAFCGIIIAGLVGAVILLLFKPDQAATYAGLLVQLIGLASVGAGTFYGLNEVVKRTDVIKHQTNGTLSALWDRNRALEDENTQLRELIAKGTKDVQH